MSDFTQADWRLLLTEAERACMLQDIAQVSLAVGRQLFADRTWDDLDIAAGSLLSRKSPVERLGFIARILPALTQTVEQIAQGPLATARTEEHRVAPPERARRPATGALLQAARRGHAGRWLTDRKTVLSPDTPENRALFSFLRTLHRDSRAVGRMAEAAGEADIAGTAHVCAGRLRGLRERLGWDGVVAPEELSAQAETHRMLGHPAYARLHAWMRQYRQSFAFDWDSPVFTLPARETWRLYEAWGLLQTVQALTTLGFVPDGAGAGDHARSLFGVRQDRLWFRLVKGEESRLMLGSPRGEALGVFYNRSYPARRRSLSRTMQPDIALEDGGGRAWILDPKFKAYARPGDEGDDIDQMHAYRDAIIDREQNKPVQRAWCLYTGESVRPTRPLIAYGPPGRSVVGALCLRPGQGDGLAHLCRLLSDWGLVPGNTLSPPP